VSLVWQSASPLCTANTAEKKNGLPQSLRSFAMTVFSHVPIPGRARPARSEQSPAQRVCEEEGRRRERMWSFSHRKNETQRASSDVVGAATCRPREADSFPYKNAPHPSVGAATCRPLVGPPPQSMVRGKLIASPTKAALYPSLSLRSQSADWLWQSVIPVSDSFYSRLFFRYSRGLQPYTRLNSREK